MKAFRKIRKVAVLGSGVMGSQIAAHCINAGLEVLLLDLKSEDQNRPNKIAEESLKKILKLKPAPFADPDFGKLIQVGNFDDDFDKLSEIDWICEVVIERMDIKQDLLAKIDSIRPEKCIVSSNTSGLPISEISTHCSASLKEHFLGTHFFNPPRYMHLLELIPIKETRKDIVETMTLFFDQVLGKGVVECKDTPNFIANRIGVYSMASLLPYFFNGEFRAEDIDVLCGTLTGYSKAASFRTADIAGLDVLAHVASNLYPTIPDDEQREIFNLPSSFLTMVQNGLIGNKSGKGFYKKVQTKSGREFHVINPNTLDYEPQKKTEFDSLKQAKAIKKLDDRLRFLVNSDTREGHFVWEVQRQLMLYAANRVPEISNSIEAIDRAMKWGFNWELGPFERWDAIGIEEACERISKQGMEIPILIQEMLDEGITNFYKDGKVYDPISKSMIQIPQQSTKEITKSSVYRNKAIFENNSAALHDLGDGIALFEFRTKNATLNTELVQSLEQSISIIQEDYEGMVISHWGANFAFGADLMEAITKYKQGDIQGVYKTVDDFQRTAVALRYAPFPVVVAPFGMALGGGAEFIMYSDKVVAHHELYMGLVEVGVGLIPAGGGTTELLKRAMHNLPAEADQLPFIKEVFKTIGLAKVSESAEMAKKMMLLPSDTIIEMNRNNLLSTAKDVALSMINEGYHPPRRMEIPVLGKKAESTLNLMLYVMNEAGFATDYDKVVTGRVAKILSGGGVLEPQMVSEEYVLGLEREAIYECLNDERSQARIEHMLKTGKPLRN